MAISKSIIFILARVEENEINYFIEIFSQKCEEKP
jgi:hypothetical protein